MNFFVKNEEGGRLSITALTKIEQILDDPTAILGQVLKGITEKLTEEVYKKYRKEILSKIDTKEIVSIVTANLLKKLSE